MSQPSLRCLGEVVAIRLIDKLAELPKDEHPKVIKEAIKSLSDILNDYDAENINWN